MSVIKVDKNNFQSEVMNSDKPVLVDFWAPWCGPCRAQTPILQTLSEQCGDKVKICKVNTDEQEELSRKFGIMSIPTIMVFRGGKLADKAVGVQSIGNLTQLAGI